MLWFFFLTLGFVITGLWYLLNFMYSLQKYTLDRLRERTTVIVLHKKVEHHHKVAGRYDASLSTLQIDVFERVFDCESFSLNFLLALNMYLHYLYIGKLLTTLTFIIFFGYNTTHFLFLFLYPSYILLLIS